jgi:hypothetical protein
MSQRKLVLLALLGLLVLPAPSAGQGLGVNGKARTYMSYLQVRGLDQDSVPAATVPGDGAQRTLPDGTRVTCTDGWCRFFRSGAKVGIAPFLQDFELNAWSGIQGLRGYTHVRLRAQPPIGETYLWPRMRSEVEALAAYLEYRRSNYLIKAGRIWQSTSLGFYNYDGGSFQLRLPSQLELNAYGGLSLVRGLNQLHHTDLIGSVESLAPREDAYIYGLHARWRPIPSLATSFTYQKESTTHEGNTYSERIAGSARAQLQKASVEVEVKYDLATETTNLARLAIAAPLGGGFRGSGEVRKYVPFFELWTIWGAFSPVGYNEARARLDWTSSRRRLSLRAYGSYRAFGDTETSDIPEEFQVRDDAYRLAAGGSYSLKNDMVLDGEYRYDVGYGASRSGGDVSLQRTFAPRKSLGIRATGFESFSEFGVGSGRVLGGGIQGSIPLRSATLQANAMFYQHTQNDRPSRLDLNQTRVNFILEVPIGGDPGMSRGGDQ